MTLATAGRRRTRRCDDLGGPLSWDLAFLTLGAGLLLAGWALASSADESHERLR
ncbi:MAG: hypothetical protein QOF68_750 [Gaiellales bacterium]|nr:hypothetical protein [Gaiellales bacterium]